jgi:hypothetical protein
MKTVKEIAGELGVSIKTVYRKINELLLSQSDDYVKNVNGKMLINREGKALIKKNLSRISLKTSKDNDKVFLDKVKKVDTYGKFSDCHDKEKEVRKCQSDKVFEKRNDKLYETMSLQIRDLQNRLTASDTLIKDMTMTIKEQQAASNQQILNLQILLKQEQEKNIMFLGESVPKKPREIFFDNIDEKPKENIFKRFFSFLVQKKS